MIDSHAHLFDRAFSSDLEEVLERAQEAGIERIVVPGTTRETSAEAVELAERYPFLSAAVGYHPHDAARASDSELSAIEEMARHPKVVAIGEIGLDYYYDFAPKEIQQRAFEEQLAMATRLNLPVIVHTRDSMSVAIETVGAAAENHPGWCNGAVGGAPRRGVFHCFTGDVSQAHRLFELGFYVSFPGIVTFKKSSALETVKAIGLSRVMLETDSPYLTPVPFRGKRNEPSYLPLIAQNIAEALQISVAEVAEETARNARSLFLFEISPTHTQENVIHRV